MRIDQRENSLGKGHIGQLFVGPFSGVFDGVRQKLELIHEVRKQRLVYLGKFQFPLRQVPENFFDNSRRNRRRPAIDKFNNLSHGALSAYLQIKKREIIGEKSKLQKPKSKKNSKSNNQNR